MADHQFGQAQYGLGRRERLNFNENLAADPCVWGCGALAEPSQQSLGFRLRQPAPDHRLRHSPLAIKLVAFGKGAFV